MSEMLRVILQDGQYVIEWNREMPDALTARYMARLDAERVVRLMALSGTAFRINAFKIGGIAHTDLMDEQPWQELNASMRESNGTISVLSATAVTQRSVNRELDVWFRWHDLSDRVRAAIDLFYEAQCVETLDIQHILLMSAVEVLIEPEVHDTVLGTLSKPHRKALVRCVNVLLTQVGVPQPLRERVTNLMPSVKIRSNQIVALEYMTAHAPNGFAGLGDPATGEEIKQWFTLRNSYIHSGARMDNQPLMSKLLHIVGECLRDETGLHTDA